MMDTPLGQQLMRKMMNTQVRKMTMANASFPQQLDALRASARSTLPAALQQELLSPIEQLIVSAAESQALKEGDQVPDFTLFDALGNAVTLSHLLKQGPVVIAFYRGAWCPYCNLQLHAYQRILPQIQALGASLVAISPQTPDHSLTLAEKRALTFAVLSDGGNQIARQFGLVFPIDEAVRATYRQVGANLPEYNGDGSWELPMPGTFLIDPSGIVRLAFVDPDFTHRLDPSIIIARLKELQSPI
jgi:peroxiredoxin